MPNRSSVRGHIDFAVSSEEIKICVFCGKPPQPSNYGNGWYDNQMTVTPPGRHPVAGLVGVCSSCDWGRVSQKKILAHWRPTAPSLVQIIPNVPVQLVARGCCDDTALAQVIRDTLEEKVPLRSRRKILDYVLSDGSYCVTGKGLRFEALGRWPGMGTCSGMCMDRGHVIRLRSSFVKSADIESLVEVIAHELGHTEQNAETKRFDSADECERDVEARLRSWGIDNGTTRGNKRMLLNQFDQIINYANLAKRIVRRSKLPSGNYATDAHSDASKAHFALMRSLDRWQGT